MLTRRLLAFALLALGFSTSSPLQAQDFYDIGTVNTIDITFAESNWDQLLDALYAAGDEERLIGTVAINGEVFENVGIRYKGNSTYRSNQVKNPFNIKLDHVIEDQELDGYGTLKLANVSNDPSFVREVLGYEIARRYLPSPEANFANVTVNGQLIGLYTSVQDVDRSFAGNAGYGRDNIRFKGELAGGGAPSLTPIWNYRGTDSTAYYAYYEAESDFGWEQLISFLDTFNNDPAAMEEVLNVDRHLWMLALDVLMVNLDAPVNFAHNYYLFEDNAGRFNPIMWDLNENFGVFSRLLDGGDLSTTQMQQLDPFLNASNANFPIVQKVLSDPTYRRMYVAHMKTIMDDVFASGWYETRALEIQSVIDAHVQADPNKFYSYANFLSNVSSSVSSGGGPGGGRQTVGITQLMDPRVEYISALSAFTAAAPEVTSVASVPQVASQFSEATITADVADATTVTLAYRSSAADAFTKVTMLDDGASGDGASGDGTYGATVQVGAADVEYYVYAENAEAGSFSPVRAAYDFYTLRTGVGDIVINEFMADNESTVADQDGEFDDWIELYNNAASPITLTGYGLSDDADDLMQFVFPETTIPAGGYIIVWADGDIEQDGLHADFGLSRNGETLFLTLPDGSTITDEVTFGAQTPDISTGRYPNGTGDFAAMAPSYAAENMPGIVDTEEGPTVSAPEALSLSSNRPNPFSGATTIEFSLRAASPVTLTVYNAIGQKLETLASGDFAAGDHAVTWNASGYASGLYFYAIQAGGSTATRSMSVVR